MTDDTCAFSGLALRSSTKVKHFVCYRCSEVQFKFLENWFRWCVTWAKPNESHVQRTTISTQAHTHTHIPIAVETQIQMEGRKETPRWKGVLCSASDVVVKSASVRTSFVHSFSFFIVACSHFMIQTIDKEKFCSFIVRSIRMDGSCHQWRDVHSIKHAVNKYFAN